jgi:hypothetical protein
LTTNTERGLWAQESTTSVWKTGCVDVDSLLHTDGRITGRVTTAKGKPARYAQVAIVAISTEGNLSLSSQMERGISSLEVGNPVAILSAPAYPHNRAGVNGNRRGPIAFLLVHRHLYWVDLEVRSCCAPAQMLRQHLYLKTPNIASGGIIQAVEIMILDDVEIDERKVIEPY